MNIIVLGNGLLGSEIVKQTGWDNLNRWECEFDFCDISSYNSALYKYDIIFNCIGHTNTYDNDIQKHWDINYKGVVALADFCDCYNIKLVHVSTDYIYANSNGVASEYDVPVHCNNWYAYTKLLSDAYIQLKLRDFLIFRCSFKPNPWPYDNAITTQTGNFDYVDIIANQMIKLINKNTNGIYNLGTEIKTIYELAKKSKPEVIASDKILNESMPKDITMNLDKLKGVL